MAFTIKKDHVLFWVISLAVLFLVGFKVSQFVRSSRLSAYETPKIGFLELTGATVRVFLEEETSERGEHIVYCLTKQNSPDTCSWENYDEFELEEETAYYVYIKSLDSGKISPAQTFEYKKVDFSKMAR